MNLLFFGPIMVIAHLFRLKIRTIFTQLFTHREKSCGVLRLMGWRSSSVYLSLVIEFWISWLSSIVRIIWAITGVHEVEQDKHIMCILLLSAVAISHACVLGLRKTLVFLRGRKVLVFGFRDAKPFVSLRVRRWTLASCLRESQNNCNICKPALFFIVELIRLGFKYSIYLTKKKKYSIHILQFSANAWLIHSLNMKAKKKTKKTKLHSELATHN